MSDPANSNSSSSPRNIKQALHSNAMVLGDRVFFQALFAGGKPYVFTRDQMEFLWALQQMKSLAAASIAVGKDEAWAEKFLQSRKFRQFRNAKILEVSIKNGLTIEWWYEFGKHVTEGEKIQWSGFCPACKENYEFNVYEIEEARKDDLCLDLKCPVCFTPIHADREVVKIKPSREQIEAWKEIGSRILAKIERVHHTYSDEQIVFENTDSNAPS